VREPDRELVAVTYAGGRSESRLDWLTREFEFKPGAERYQFGPWSWPLIHAWGRSLDFLESYGVEAIWSRTCELTNRFKAGVMASKHLDLFTPFTSDDSAALVSFGIADSDANDLRDRLREKHNIVIKAIYATRKGMRASFPFFLLEEEIDFLLAKLEEELS
jgi:selenocysteine lyase/cysteine desulfurase